jgi:hypothetical protein
MVGRYLTRKGVSSAGRRDALPINLVFPMVFPMEHSLSTTNDTFFRCSWRKITLGSGMDVKMFMYSIFLKTNQTFRPNLEETRKNPNGDTIGSLFVTASKSHIITFWSQSRTYRPQHVRRVVLLDIQSGTHQRPRESTKWSLTCEDAKRWTLILTPTRTLPLLIVYMYVGTKDQLGLHVESRC